jgi:hypothetical protein
MMNKIYKYIVKMTPIEFEKKKTGQTRDDSFQYINKLRSALLASLLFLILSNHVSYKILDLIFSSFSNNQHVLDDENNVTFVGNFTMALIIAILVFVF